MKKALILTSLLLIGKFLFSQSGSQIYTSSGNFVVPNGVNSLTIEIVGAGGAGGINGTGGGGGGGYALGVFNVTSGTSYAVTIGIGGSGSSGGTSSVGSLISATGGGNGVSVSNPNIGGGGAGGTGINGNVVNRTGGTGGGGYYTYFGGGGGGAGGSTSNGTNGGNSIAWTGVCLTPGGTAGAGGGAPGGNGGKGAGFTDVNCSITDPSGNGANYGGGGGGGNGAGGGPGTGADGYCVISWGNCVAPNAPINITNSSNLSICNPSSTTLTASSSGSVSWYSSPSGNLAIGTGTNFITPVLTTNTTFYAEAITCSTSTVRTPITITVNPTPTVTILTFSATICSGQQSQLNGSGAVSYTWSPYNAVSMTSSIGVSTSVSPTVTTTYTLLGVSSDGCLDNFTTSIVVNPSPTVTVLASPTVICSGSTSTLNAGGATLYNWSPYNSATMTNSVGPVTVVTPTISTNYTLTGLDVNGCEAKTSVSLTVNALPNLTVTTSGKLILCKGNSATLTAGGASTYSWNTNSTNTLISIAPTTNTTYTVTGTGQNGCVNSFVFTQSVSLCTAIDKTQNELAGLIIFPNPNDGEFSVKSDLDIKVNITNELGQFIKTVSLDNSNGHTYTFKNFAAGVYFITDTKNEIKQKVVISK